MFIVGALATSLTSSSLAFALAVLSPGGAALSACCFFCSGGASALNLYACVSSEDGLVPDGIAGSVILIYTLSIVASEMGLLE